MFLPLTQIVRRLLFPEQDSDYDHDFSKGLTKVEPDIQPPQVDRRNFICPECGSGSLAIKCSIELGSDARDDEYSLQAVMCGSCDMVGVATYQESRRGAEDSWDHIGYRMEKSDFHSLLGQLSGCGARTKPKCSCDAHRLFGVKAEHGRLEPLKKLEHDKTQFIMRFS